MSEPNPIWGLHVTPGAIAGALVRRSGDVYEVLDTFRLDAPTDSDGLVTATERALQGRGVSGRVSLTAVPDHELAVGTGTIPSDELYLNDEEIYHHLHDFAPFEPGEGQLAYRSVGPRDDRKYLVAAISPHAQAALDAMAIRLDEQLHGIGLATPALVRGARALGLVEGRTFLVDVQARQTVVVAVDGSDERRYLLGCGLELCAGSMDATERLAADLHRVLAYHADVARRDPPSDLHEPVGDVVPVGPNASRARELLNRALGDRLAPPGRRGKNPERITDVAGGALSDELLRTHVGSIGAALEGLASPETRFVLRHPPLEAPDYVATDAGSSSVVAASGAPASRASRRTTVLAVGGIALVALAIAAWAVLTPRDAPVDQHPSATGYESADTNLPDDLAPAPADIEREAARARTALGDLALNIAHARGIAAASAALSSWDPPHRARSYEVENVRGTLHITLLAEVESGITPDVRRAVRTAVERTPGIERVGIDINDGALRVRCRTAVAPRPEPGEGPRQAYLGGFAAEDDAAASRRVPVDADGRPVLSSEQAREISAATHARGTRLLLSATEIEFMHQLLAEAEALSAVLPQPAASSSTPTGNGN